MEPNLKTSPFAWEDRNNYNFTPYELDLANKILNIFDSNGGIYVLAGHRGTGKSSIVSYANHLNDFSERKNIIITVPYYEDSKTFHRELLEQIKIKTNYLYLQSVESCKKLIDEILNIDFIKNRKILPKITTDSVLIRINGLIDEAIKNLSVIPSIKNGRSIELERKLLTLNNATTQLKKIKNNLDGSCILKSRNNRSKISKIDFMSSLESLNLCAISIKEQINEVNKLINFYDVTSTQLLYIEAEVSSTSKFLKNTTTDLSVGSKLDVSPSIQFFSSSLSLASGYKSEISDEISDEVKNTVSHQMKLEQLSKLLGDITSKFKITIIVEELDKLNHERTLDIINNNKLIFLNSSINVILVTDIYNAVYLAENSDYVPRSNILIVKSNRFQDYLYRKNLLGFSLNNDIFSELRRYFDSMLINRNILDNEGSPNTNCNINNGALLSRAMNILESSGVPMLYQEAAIRIIWEVIDHFSFTEKISSGTIDEIVFAFKEKNQIESSRTDFVLSLLHDDILKFAYHGECKLLDIPVKFKDYQESIRIIMNEFNSCNQILFPLIYHAEEDAYILGKETNLAAPTFCFNDNNKYFIMEEFYNELINELRPAPPALESDNVFIGDTSRIGLQYFELIDYLIKTNNILGIVLFNPKYENKIQYNATVISYNSFGEYYYYNVLGYPGLQSYSPGRLQERKRSWSEKFGIQIKEIKDSFNAGSIDDLENYVKNNIHQWIELFRKK